MYKRQDQKGAFRSIGINRNDFMALIQMRPDQPEDSRVLEWIAFASNASNVLVPFYALSLIHIDSWLGYVSPPGEGAPGVCHA